MRAEPTHDAVALQNLTLVLAALAAVATELALVLPGASVLPGLGVVVLLLAGSTSAMLYLRSRKAVSRRDVFLVAVLLLPVWLLDPLRAVLLLGNDLPAELIAFVLMRDAGLLLAALGVRPVLLRASAGLNTALVLCAGCVGQHDALLLLLVAYAAVGSLWLTFLYWDRVRPDLLPGRGSRSPVTAPAVLWGVLLCALAVLAAGPRRVAGALGELAPTSGGTRDFDRRARGGVGDGDAATAGRNPHSTGFVNSDIFLDSDERSLYDAASDLFGEARKKKEQGRAVALSAEQIRHLHSPGRPDRPQRSFSLVRNAPDRAAAPPDAPGNAQVYVSGPTPLHLRLVVYDVFDGRDMHEAPTGRLSGERVQGGGWGWLWLLRDDAPFLSPRVSHEIKINRLRSNRLPVPPHLHAFRLGRVDQPDLFHWSEEEFLRLADGGPVPDGLTLETSAWTVGSDRLREVPFHESSSWAERAYLLADGIDPRVADLAQAWTAGLPHGWRQVEAVVARLRAEYAVDRSAVAPDDADPVAHFLLESRCGPEYLFAASATLLLRSLGLPVRVALGLYARPERYDPETGHTPVFRSDLHYWPEVQVPGGRWVVIEPTPGYDVLGPAPTWAETAWAALTAPAGWLAAHPVTVGLALLGLAALAWRRREALDVAATLRWRLASWGRGREQVLATLRLLECRARLAGRTRPRGRPIAAHYCALARRGGSDAARILEIGDWAAYAPEPLWRAAPWREDEVWACCRAAAHEWGLARLRRELVT